MDQRFGRIAIVIGNDGQGAQGFRLESIYRSLACFAMLAPVGNFGQPMPDLAIDIVQVGKFTQGPKVLPQIADGPFDLTFGRSRQLHPWVTGREIVFA
jgi:hypothetical protein